nr:response regulator transcription factor [Pseudonocardia acaciae]
MTRIVLVDDDAMVRAGLRMVLSADPTLRVVAEATNGRQALEVLRDTDADVVLMDLQMPVLDGVAATRELRTHRRTPAVLVLTTFDVDTYVVEALRAGASGYVLKDTPPEEIIRAVHVAAAGDSVFSATVTERIVARISSRDDATTADARRRLARLTEREREVADAIAAGSSNATIASDLRMSEATVKSHVSRILTKTGAENRVQVALLVYQTGTEKDSEITDHPRR